MVSNDGGLSCRPWDRAVKTVGTLKTNTTILTVRSWPKPEVQPTYLNVRFGAKADGIKHARKSEQYEKKELLIKEWWYN